MLDRLLKRKTAFPFLYCLLAVVLGELLVFALIWKENGWLPVVFLATAAVLISSKQIGPLTWLFFFGIGCLAQTVTLKLIDTGKVEYVGCVCKGGTGSIEASMGKILVDGEWMNLPAAVNIKLSNRDTTTFPGQIIWTAGKLERQESYPLFRIVSSVEGCIDKVEIISFPGKFVDGLLSKYKLRDTIAAAIFTGNRRHIDYETRGRISDLGVAHLFAVSGLHIGLMYLLVHSLLSFLMLGRNARILISVTILFFYTLSTGPAISALRTFLMLFCYSIFRLIDYRQHPLNILGISGMILVIAQPSIVASISFQMSFFATAALLSFLPEIENRNLICQAFLIGLIAQTAVIPLSLSTFGTLSVVGIPLTIMMVPIFVVPAYVGMIVILMADLLGLRVISDFVSGSLRAMSIFLEETTNMIGRAIPAIRLEPFPAYLVSLLSLFLFFIALWHFGHKP